MKLQRVVLTNPIRLPGMNQAEVEITDKECPELRYNERLCAVVFGNGIERPREQVLEWERANEQLVCEDCDEEFVNAQGLGGHRARSHPPKKGSAA